MTDFEQCEMDHGNALATWKRISCFAHTLQLVRSLKEPLALIQL